MGDVHNNPNAVCDSKLKVKGIDGLRIADASVLPFCTSGNINTAILMIGKKCGKSKIPNGKILESIGNPNIF